jgi:hypothetical protein
MMRTKTIGAVAVLTVAVLTSVVACDSKYSEPFKDAPRSGVDNESPMNVIEGSDGFSNIGWKCVGLDGVYVAYHGDNKYAAISVVANDPNCAPGSTVPGARAR